VTTSDRRTIRAVLESGSAGESAVRACLDCFRGGPTDRILKSCGSAFATWQRFDVLLAPAPATWEEHRAAL